MYKTKYRLPRETTRDINNLEELTATYTPKGSIELASEKGAPTWLTTLPIRAHGFSLHKQAFWDALCVRYGWEPQGLPSLCSCGAQFKTTHVHFFNRHRGAFSTIRHNCIQDLTSHLLTEVWPSVEVRFWGNERQGAFFDVRVFNPFAPSHASQTIQSTYRKNEMEKRRQYEKRIIDIEPGSFTPLVMSATGRLKLGPSARVFYKRLTRMISQKHLTPYCEINEDNLVQAFLFTCRHPHWHDRQWGPLVNSVRFCFQW